MALNLLLKCFLPTGSSKPNYPYLGYEMFYLAGLWRGIGRIINKIISAYNRLVTENQDVTISLIIITMESCLK